VLERSFCGNCGSNVRTRNLTNPNILNFVIIPIGIVDGDKEALKPTNEYYTKRRAAWFPGVQGSDEKQEM